MFVIVSREGIDAGKKPASRAAVHKMNHLNLPFRQHFSMKHSRHSVTPAHVFKNLTLAEPDVIRHTSLCQLFLDAPNGQTNGRRRKQNGR